MNNRLKNSAVCMALSIVLCACGGSNSLGGIDASGGPVTAGNVSTGAINGFGSVIVNGVRYNSDRAKILIDNQISNEENLRSGYQVKVTATINSDGSAIADTIEFYPNLVSTISDIDLTSQQLTLLNHKVQVTSETLFDAAIKPNYLSGLKLGDSVLVSGFTDDKGLITATRIELSSSANRQAMGYVSNLNESSFTFTLKNQSVNYGAATLTNFTNNQITANALLVATGTLDAKGVLQAKTLVRINNSFDKSIKSAETEGFITRFASATDFDVAGITWIANSQTTFENGSAANLASGVSLSVKGELNSSGQLIAQKIEFKKSSSNEIVGEVTGISADASANIATGTVFINGTRIQTNSKTRFEDKGSSKLKRFNFSSINTGDFLKISGYSTQGTFIATKIERDDIKSENDTALKLNGIILSVETHSFVVYGRTIVTDSKTEIKSERGDKLTESQFYARAIGQRVEVEGILKNGIFTANKIEFESNSED